MKKPILPILLLLTALAFTSCKEEKKETVTEIVLTNNSEMEMTDKAVSVKRDMLSIADSINKFPVLISSGDTIPSQLSDVDGDGKWDEIFFVANFSANEKKNLQLKWTEKSPEFGVRTSVRFGKREAKDEPVKPATEETLLALDMPKKLGFQKYQTDGPTWENDKVGFRHYLDGRNAKDVFGKKTSVISPENVGINAEGAVEDNYHVMEDWGRDVFPVGNSVGLGGYALLINDEVKRLGVTVEDTLSNVEKTTFKITEEGPVKSVVNYTYSNWEASENAYQVKETTTIWPGMYGYQNTVLMDGLKGNETFLIALSNINNENPLKEIENDNWVALVLHDSLTYEREWVMGTALILPKKGYQGYKEAQKNGQLTQSYLAKYKISNNIPITYYAVAGWELSQDKNFSDSKYFTKYVTNLANQLYTPIIIKIRNTTDKNLEQ